MVSKKVLHQTSAALPGKVVLLDFCLKTSAMPNFTLIKIEIFYKTFPESNSTGRRAGVVEGSLAQHRKTSASNLQ